MADSDAFGQLAVRGVTEKHHAAAGDDRRVSLGHVELLEHLVHFRIGFQVHPGEQHAVLGQEVTYAKGVGRVTRPDYP